MTVITQVTYIVQANDFPQFIEKMKSRLSADIASARRVKYPKKRDQLLQSREVYVLQRELDFYERLRVDPVTDEDKIKAVG